MPASESPATGCVFCDLTTDPTPLVNRLVYEDESFYVSHQMNEGGLTYLGVLLIQAKRHVPNLAALSDMESERLGWLIGRVSRALLNCTAAAWTYCFGFTEGYRHVHVIVAARYPAMPKEYVRLAFADWPDAPRGGRAEVVALSAQLRSEIRSPAPKQS